MGDPLNIDIIPSITCVEATQMFDELPPKDQLGEEHAPTLMLIEGHRLQAEHTPDCFVNRTMN